MDWRRDLESRISENLARFDRRELPLEGRRHAAVAVVVVADESGRACFVLTQRASMKRHSRQFALPGGRLDPGETVEDAVLRETMEEVGLEAGPQRILGRLDDYATRSGFVMTPVVAWGVGLGEMERNPDEVAAVYRVPLEELDKPEVPVLHEIEESDRPVLSVPLLDTLVFSPTASILYQFREVALHGRSTRVAHYEQPVFAWR